MKVLIVVPAYNEEKKIGRVIRGLFEQGFKDVLVVDDNSTDDTSKESKKEGALVLRHSVNRGQGAALETGNEYARRNGYDLVVHFDGDDQFNPRDIRKCIEKMKIEECDIILGSRFLDNRSQIPWSKKNILLPVSKFVNFIFTGVKLTDAHNGFRILNKRALNEIRIVQDKMAHNTEIVRQIKEKNLKFCECPVEIKYHEYGQGVSGGLKIIWDLIIEKLK